MKNISRNDSPSVSSYDFLTESDTWTKQNTFKHVYTESVYEICFDLRVANVQASGEICIYLQAIWRGSWRWSEEVIAFGLASQ